MKGPSESILLGTRHAHFPQCYRMQAVHACTRKAGNRCIGTEAHVSSTLSAATGLCQTAVCGGLLRVGVTGGQTWHKVYPPSFRLNMVIIALNVRTTLTLQIAFWKFHASQNFNGPGTQWKFSLKCKWMLSLSHNLRKKKKKKKSPPVCFFPKAKIFIFLFEKKIKLNKIIIIK